MFLFAGRLLISGSIDDFNGEREKKKKKEQTTDHPNLSVYFYASTSNVLCFYAAE